MAAGILLSPSAGRGLAHLGCRPGPAYFGDFCVFTWEEVASHSAKLA